MFKRAQLVILLVATASGVACSNHARVHPDGGSGTNGGSGSHAGVGSAGHAAGDAGGLSTGGGDKVDAGASGFRATINASTVNVCPGQCADLSAVALGGVPAYHFSWDHALGSGAGPHHVCPKQTTRYSVTVSDSSTSTSAEFGTKNTDVSASVSVRVAAASECADGGMPGEPSRELCSFRGHIAKGGIEPAQAQKNHHTLVDSHGNVVLLGSFNGTLELGSKQLVSGGPLDAFVLKLDPNCHLLWAKSFGGRSTGQAWLNAMAQDSQDNLYLGGATSGVTDLIDTINMSGSGQNGILMKLDSGGNLLWAHVHTSAQAVVEVTDLVIDSQHRITMVGNAGADTSFGGTPLNFIYSGNTPFLVQFKADDTFGWSKAFTSAELLYGLATGPSDDGFVLTGWAADNVDLGAGALAMNGGGRYLAKLTSQGTQVWLNALPDDHNAADQWNWWKGGVAIDAQGGIFVLRDAPQTLPGNSGDRVLDDSVEKYTTGGAPVWQSRLSNTSVFNFSYGSGLVLTPEDHALRLGEFSGTTTYVDHTLVSRGGSDVALIEVGDKQQIFLAYALGGALDEHALGVTIDAAGNAFASYTSIQNADGDSMDLVVVKVARK